MNSRRFLWHVATALLFVTLGAARAVSQQTADVIRGRIIGSDSLPIPGANILVTSFGGGINKRATTDKNGKFSVVFPNGEGDYMVGIAAIGYNFTRFELKRLAEEEILIADRKLEKQVTRLDTVTTTTAAKRTTPTRSTSTNDLSGTDKFTSSGSVAAGQAGNIAAMVAGLPGFQLIPGVDGNPDMLSVLGLDPTQNNMTMNGANGGGDLPRDAGVSVNAGTSQWSPSRGGFSGAQIQLSTQPGNNYLSRGTSSQLDAPSLQWTDNTGNATSAQYTRLSLGGRFGGPIEQDHAFYNSSIQYDRQFKDLSTLFNANALSLQTAGVSPDSVARLRSVLQQLGIPSGGQLGNPTTDDFRQQAVFDFSPKSATSGSSYQLGELFNFNRQQPTNTSLMATPAFSGESQRISGSVVGRHTNYLWSSVLTQTWLSASVSSIKNDPQLLFPSANVRVSSELDDGTSTVRNLQFGGNSSLGTNSTTGQFSAKNQLGWYAGNNRHALKLTSEVHDDWYDTDDPRNRRGTFTFQSLADLEAGVPSQFTRQLATISEKASQMTGSVALEDAWRAARSGNVQVVYGFRVDGNRFLTRPDFNQTASDLAGTRNDRVPNGVYVSPRVGMSWTYGKASIIPLADFFITGPRASVRAGTGIYQNIGGASLLGSTLNQTGLPGASQTLTCVGPAAPQPDWTTYLSNPNAVPGACADGSSVFASSVPSVSLFGKSYAQARTWKTNVNWNGTILDNRFTLNADATYSLGLNQTGSVDLNFDPTQRFALDNEGGRPVYANASSIDPRSGLVATREARRSTDFSEIRSINSDLRNDARQLTIGLSPFTFNPTRFSWNASYTLSDIHDRYNGYSGASGPGNTATSPLEYAWGRSSNSLHTLAYTLNYNFWDYVRVSWQGRFQSGSRYTPSVAGDINGDGRFGNDRAFVFNPTAASDPALAAQMQSLIDRAPGGARKCLQQQMGAVAGRNSCTGPWTAGAGTLSITLNSQKVWMPPRTQFTISVSNPLVAADLLFHGSNGLHGWGETPAPDAALLYVRGFDPATQRYKYEVNQRFGSTDLSNSVQRQPVVVTAGFTINVAPTRDWQSMRMMLERGRSKPGNKVLDAQMRTMSTVLGVINPMSRILSQREQLKLTRKQADSLSNLSRTFQTKVDSLWLIVANYYATLPVDFNRGLAHEKFVIAREEAADYLIKIAPAVKALMTPAQLRKLGAVATYLEPRYLEQVKAGLISSGLPIEMMMMGMR